MKKSLVSDIELMIIPEICFDYEKNMIGFGDGYYDRYLSYKTNMYRGGICFSEQILCN